MVLRRKLAQLRCRIHGQQELLGLQGPGPVQADRARRIHAMARVEAEEILHRHDGEP